MGKLGLIWNIGKSIFSKRGAAAAAEGAEQVAKEPGFLSRMWSGKVGTALRWGGGALGLTALYDGVANGGGGIGNFIRNLGSKATNVPAEISSDMTVASTEFNLYNILAMVGRFLKLFKIGGNSGIAEALMSAGAEGVEQARNPDAAAPSANGNDGPGFGTAALTALGVGAGAGVGASMLRGRGGPSGGGNTPTPPAGGPSGGTPTGGERPGATPSARDTAESDWKKVTGKKAATEAAEEGVEAVVRGSRRFGRLGKIFAVGGGVAVGLGVIGGEEAEAATLTSAATRGGATVTGGGAGALQSLGADAAGFGLSILGGKAAAETVAHAAAPVAARLGLSTIAKSIPGVSAIYAAGETIFNVGGDILRGDVKKAGLNLVSGIGETVAGLGGALTYWTLGTAWRESVRGAGAMAFGEENTINHSLAVEVGGGVGSWLKEQFFGATSGSPSATAQPSYRRDNTGPAFAF